MSDNSRKIARFFKALTLIVLVVMNFSLHTRLTHMQHTLNHLQINQFHSPHVHYLQDTLTRQLHELEAQIERIGRPSFGETWRILSYDPDTLSAQVELGFNLQQFGLDDTVSVTATGSTGDSFTAVATLHPHEPGRFTAQLHLPLQDNFELSFSAMGSAVSTGHLLRLPLANQLAERFQFETISDFWNYHEGQIVTERSLNITPLLHNDTQGDPLLEIRSASLVALSEQTVLQAWDLLPYLATRPHGQSTIFERRGWADFDHEHTFQLRQEPETPVATAIKLVIYDNLGIRYEQLDILDLGWWTDWQRQSSAQRPMQSSPVFHISLTPDRLINPGQEAWHTVHMVRPTP